MLEALSASGLRSIRYAKEIPGLSDIVANDFSKKAVESIERNVSANGVSDAVRASNADAAALMYSRRKAEERFTIVDLDPYGSAAPFLDAAVQVRGVKRILVIGLTVDRTIPFMDARLICI